MSFNDESNIEKKEEEGERHKRKKKREVGAEQTKGISGLLCHINCIDMKSNKNILLEDWCYGFSKMS